MLDKKNKIVFGCSPKVGSSHIKIIYAYLCMRLSEDKILKLKSGEIHGLVRDQILGYLPKEIIQGVQNYNFIFITRNPYERLISGIFDKYTGTNKGDGEFRSMWPENISLTFRRFISALIVEDWDIVEKDHFSPQSESFNQKYLNSNLNVFDLIKSRSKLKIFDIKKIDYNFIENLYNKKLPISILKKKQGHESSLHEHNSFFKTNVDTEIQNFAGKNINKHDLLIDELKQKIYNFYLNDFINFGYVK